MFMVIHEIRRNLRHAQQGDGAALVRAIDLLDGLENAVHEDAAAVDAFTDMAEAELDALFDNESEDEAVYNGWTVHEILMNEG